MTPNTMPIPEFTPADVAYLRGAGRDYAHGFIAGYVQRTGEIMGLDPEARIDLSDLLWQQVFGS